MFFTLTTIAIDYTPALRQRAGIGRIVRGQVNALIQANPGYDLRLFIAGKSNAQERSEGPLPIASFPLSERTLTRIWHRLDCPLPRVEWATGGPLDLLHATDFVLPPSGARRKLLTIHDLAFLFYPDAAMPSLHHYLNTVVPRSVRRAHHIAADSYHTARDLQEEWAIPVERITVVQGAVDHAHFRPVSDPARLAAVRARYKIGDAPFIFTLSKLEPRKNHVRLIEAFHAAQVEGQLPHKLVIGGGKGWLYDAIFAKVADLHLEERVIFTGFIDDADLPALYSAAEFFAYPSLYEGFGLPIVEALACGAPVLTANNSCLPEAGGDGALYVNALDAEEIANAILRLAQDTALRSRLCTAGRAHAANFTWEHSAQQLIAAYTKTLAS